MGVVAEIGRLACCAWAPSGSHVAAGTYAGAVDTSFEANSSLELLQLDVSNARLVPSAPLHIPEKFSSIAWGPVARTHPAGLIAGGLNDGAVRVWDAATLLRPSSDAVARDPSRGLLLPANLAPKHTGPVHGLSFNHFVCTLLATGGSDGHVLIWDLANAGSPVVRPPGNTESGSKDEIISVSWNPKVQHILGTGSSSGVVSVWDAKNRKQVINIRNPRGRLRASSLVWHPQTPTQVLVCCDEDDGSGAQLWDLRNATAPLCSLSHHAPRGIMAATWCPHDADLVLTSSRDGRSVIVCPSTGELVAELPKSATWNFDVQWSPRTPGVYLSSSFDGRVSVNSILTANAAASVSAETANALAESFGPDVGDFQSGMAVQSPRTLVAERQNVTMNRPPKWLRPPCAVSFAFGGRAVTVATKSGGLVSVSRAVEHNPSLGENLRPVEALLASASADDPSPLAEFCVRAASEAANAAEKAAWDVLALQFQTDSRRKMLRYLGYEAAPATVGDMSDQVFGMQHSPVLANPVRSVVDKTDTADEIDAMLDGVGEPGVGVAGIGVDHLSLEGPAPWDLSGNGHGDQNGGSLLDDAPQPSENGTDLLEGKDSEGKAGKRDFSALDEAGIDATVRRAIIVGDFELAVDACLFANRSADALVIAFAGGPALWRRVQAEYLATSAATGGPALIGAAAGPKNKMDDFIHSAASGKDSWKEALALILAYVDGDEFVESCSALGQRVLEKGDFSAALTCFICAANTRMICTVWVRGRIASGNIAAALASRTERVVALVAKVRMMTAAASLVKGEPDVGAVRAYDDVSGSVLFEYGSLLANQGDFAEAIKYLNPLDPSVTGVRGNVGDAQAQANESLSIQQLESSFTENGGTSGQGPYAVSYQSPDLAGHLQAPGLVSSYGYVSQAPPPPSLPIQNLPGASGSVQQQWQRSGYGQSSPASGPVSVPSFPITAASQAPPVPLPPQPGAVSGSYTKTVYPSQGAVPHSPAVPEASVQNGYSVMTPAAPAPPVPQFPSAPGPPPSPLGSGGTVADSFGQVGPSPQALQSRGLSSGASAPPSVTPPVPSMPAAPSVPSVMMPSGILPSGPPAPPPPPPLAPDAPPPMPYHANATRGAGAGLPPSSEVAVAKQRQKPLSSSGVPGGAPKRSPSASSSLSSTGMESNVPLDRVDVRNVPAEQQVIVKSFRGAFQYASGRNNTMMYKKKMADISKKLGRLLAQLNAKELDSVVVSKLIIMAQGIAKGDYDTARQVTTALGKEVDWESNRYWLQAMHRLIDAVLTSR